MKRNSLPTAPVRTILGVSLLAVAGCASSGPQGPATIAASGEQSVDGLYLMENTAFQVAYAKENLDLSGYDAILPTNITVAYKKDPGGQMRNSFDANYALSNTQMETLGNIFREEFREALTENDGYMIATEPGPRVLEITPYLIDLIVRFPTQMEGREDSFVDSYGEVTMILELRDSQSKEILARVAERGDPTRSTYELAEVNPSFVQADVRQMFRTWANLARERLDAVRTADYANN